jgi:hypothetical protein
VSDLQVEAPERKGERVRQHYRIGSVWLPGAAMALIVGGAAAVDLFGEGRPVAAAFACGGAALFVGLAWRAVARFKQR